MAGLSTTRPSMKDGAKKNMPIAANERLPYLEKARATVLHSSAEIET